MNKIPILGIDNAGKSSIIKTFQRQFQVISEIKPTKKIQRIQIQVFDKDLFIWDFGGQERYRDRYFENAEINFADISIWFFVVDIQDQERFSEVYDYFKLCRDAIMEFSPDAYLNFIIHKFDPGLEDDNKFQILSRNLEKNLLEMSQPLKAKIYYTSIFNPMSVIHAFSKAILGDTRLNAGLMQVFNEFIDTYSLEDVIEYILVYSNDFVELGSYMNYGVNPSIYRDNAIHFFKIFDSTEFTFLDAEVLLESKGLRLYIKKDELETRKYFFICGYHPENVDDESIFRSDLKKLQKNVENIFLIY